MKYERYAVYYAPEQNSALGQFGNSWLGWDPEKEIQQDPLALGLDVKAITQTPSRYGFHGTLKPPFRLQEDTSFEALDQEILRLASARKAFSTSPLKLEKIGQFLALVPSEKSSELKELAQACVTELDHFRKEPSEAEFEKRRQAGLSPRQEELMLKWGYPFVLDEFRFHLTLTGKLEDQMLDQVHEVLRPYLGEQLNQPFKVTEICLFGDPGEGKSFHLLKRYSLS